MFEIAGRPVGPEHPPYIIAELSANHGGSLARAMRIVHGAKQAGADAIKFQAYRPQSLTLDVDAPGFVIENPESLWQGKKLYALYQEAATPYEWLPELFAEARKIGITPFASPFDVDTVAVLEGLEAPAYKIASFEAIDYELIRACARTGKPLIISTGLCTDVEIAEAVQVARHAGCTQLALLRCHSGYPAPPHELDLLTIPDMAKTFDGVPIGFSDHSLGEVSAITAVALGASLIEKHVIDDPEPPTADSAFSATPEDLKRLVDGCRSAWQARGHVRYGPAPSERGSLPFRRSILVTQDIAAGESITTANTAILRPGLGLHPRHYGACLGQPASRNLPRGHGLGWDDLTNGQPAAQTESFLLEDLQQQESRAL